MEINCHKEKILATFKDEVKKQFNNLQGSLENSDDLFIDVSSTLCITGPRLILNDRYMGSRRN